jgi:hypothetical protein
VALQNLVCELDCCLQGLVRPSDAVDQQGPLNGGDKGESRSETDLSEPRRRSRAPSMQGLLSGGTPSTPVIAAECQSTASGLHHAITQRGSSNLPDASQSAVQTARTQGGQFDSRGFQGASVYMDGSPPSEAPLGHMQTLLAKTSRFHSSSTHENRSVSILDDESVAGGDESHLGFDDSDMEGLDNEELSDRNVDEDAMSEDDLLPSASKRPSMRNPTEPFSLCSRGWRAPYAAQLHEYHTESKGAAPADE